MGIAYQIFLFTFYYNFVHFKVDNKQRHMGMGQKSQKIAYVNCE